MGWWDEVKFMVTGEQGTAVKSVKAAGAALGQAGFTAGSAMGAAANAISPGTGSAGVISMNREEMEDTLKRAQNLLADITAQRAPAQKLTNMQPPAADPGSMGATASANNAGTYYIGHLLRQEAYLNTVIDKMEQALGITIQADEDSAQAAKTAGEGAFG